MGKEMGEKLQTATVIKKEETDVRNGRGGVGRMAGP
jgi:hypothetical protein